MVSRRHVGGSQTALDGQKWPWRAGTTAPIPGGFASLLSQIIAIVPPSLAPNPSCPAPSYSPGAQHQQNLCSSGPQADQSVSLNPLTASNEGIYGDEQHQNTHCCAWEGDECSWVHPREVPEPLQGYGEPTDTSAAVKFGLLF